MTFKDIIKVLPSAVYVNVSANGIETIRKAGFYTESGHNFYDKKKVVAIRPSCISEQEAWLYGAPVSRLDIVLK